MSGKHLVLLISLVVLLVACASREERTAKAASSDDATCQSYGFRPATTVKLTLGEVRRDRQYDKMSDAALADAVYRKYDSQMPRSQFDRQFYALYSDGSGYAECRLRLAEGHAPNDAIADAQRHAAGAAMMRYGLGMATQPPPAIYVPPAPRTCDTNCYNYGTDVQCRTTSY